MVTDFDEIHDEYLISLQQRNRLLERLRRKDPVQARLEQLEQGFSLYLNGANSELRNHHRKISSHGYPKKEIKPSRTNAAQLDDSTQTAPDKMQRRGWLQKAVKIKTQRGAKLCLRPPVEYSEDFEPYESLSLETDGDDPLHDSQKLRRSLQLSVEEKKMVEDAFSDDDDDSVEEDVSSESSSAEETIPSFEDLQLHSNRFLQKEASEHQDAESCSGLDSGAHSVLEFRQDQSKVKSLRVLSAKRKANAEMYAPVSPALGRNTITRPLSAEFLHQERHERICSSKKQEYLMSTRRVCMLFPPLALL